MADDPKQITTALMKCCRVRVARLNGGVAMPVLSIVIEGSVGDGEAELMPIAMDPGAALLMARELALAAAQALARNAAAIEQPAPDLDDQPAPPAGTEPEFAALRSRGRGYQH